MKLYRDKALHAFFGFGLMAVAVVLTVLSPWFWAAAAGALAVPILWEYLTKGGIYEDGAKDIAATFFGMMLAIAVFVFGIAGLPQ